MSKKYLYSLLAALIIAAGILTACSAKADTGPTPPADGATLIGSVAENGTPLPVGDYQVSNQGTTADLTLVMIQWTKGETIPDAEQLSQNQSWPIGVNSGYRVTAFNGVLYIWQMPSGTTETP